MASFIYYLVEVLVCVVWLMRNLVSMIEGLELSSISLEASSTSLNHELVWFTIRIICS